MKADHTGGILIAPFWPWQIRLPELLPLARGNSIKFPPTLDLLLFHHNMPRLHLAVRKLYLRSLISQKVLEALLQTGRPSMRYAYHRKWRCFESWILIKEGCPFICPLPVILDCLFLLVHSGFSVSSVKTHLVAISTFHEEIQGLTVLAIFKRPV